MSGHRSIANLFKLAVLTMVAVLVTQIPTLTFGATKDVSPPKVILTPGVMVGGVPMNSVRTGKAFSLYYMVKDNSNLAKVTFTLYSNGSVIRTVSSGFIRAAGSPALWKMDAAPVPKKGPDGVGPYYVCVGAQDGAGNRSLNFPKTVCSWVAIEVPIALVSNGCGGQQWGKIFAKVQTWFLDKRKFSGIVLKFSEACDFHDAGYSGVAVWDPTLKMVMDYRPWSRKMVDDQFRQNLEYICDRDLKGKVSEAVFKTCSPGVTLAAYTVLLATAQSSLMVPNAGARTYYDAVRSFAKSAFDTDPTKPGDPQTNNMPATYPVGGGRNNS